MKKYKPLEEATIDDIQRMAKKASQQAIREAKTLGVTITYLENDKIYKEFPDGTRKVIKKIEIKKRNDLKKGMIFKSKK